VRLSFGKAGRGEGDDKPVAPVNWGRESGPLSFLGFFQPKIIGVAVI
jgi:hypothetical protein